MVVRHLIPLTLLNGNKSFCIKTILILPVYKSLYDNQPGARVPLGVRAKSQGVHQIFISIKFLIVISLKTLVLVIRKVQIFQLGGTRICISFKMF